MFTSYGGVGNPELAPVFPAKYELNTTNRPTSLTRSRLRRSTTNTSRTP